MPLRMSIKTLPDFYKLLEYIEFVFGIIINFLFIFHFLIFSYKLASDR